MTKSLFSPKYTRFRRLLVAAREQANMTQEQLGKKVGWQQTDISKVERGVRRLDVVEFLAFAKAIGINIPEFLRELERG